MSKPKTLLALSCANTNPGTLSNSTLIIIDCQQEYVDGMLPLPGVQDALSAVSDILSRARNSGAPVIHVAHKGTVGGAFDRTAASGQIVSQAAPLKTELVIEKPLPNAFAGTTLAEDLIRTGRKELIVCGFMTHMCISSTVRASLDLGYRNTVIGNACATRDLPMVGGGVLDAAALHRASLTALADRFAVIAGKSGDIPD